MVYGDTGGYELRINYVLRCVKYWLRLLNMDKDRYACKVYKMMLHASNGCNWASKIKELLLHFNFNNVWEAQSANDPTLFIRTLKQRMTEESDNNWLINLNVSNRYSVCKPYKQFRYKENYLNVISSGISRRVASLFRMGVVSLIMTHKLRFVQDSDTVCPMCMEEEEDEIHFILHGPVYHDLRSKYLAPFDSPPNVNTFQLLLRSVDESLINSSCIYLNQAFKRRKQNCDE